MNKNYNNDWPNILFLNRKEAKRIAVALDKVNLKNYLIHDTGNSIMMICQTSDVFAIGHSLWYILTYKDVCEFSDNKQRKGIGCVELQTSSTICADMFTQLAKYFNIQYKTEKNNNKINKYVVLAKGDSNAVNSIKQLLHTINVL